MIVSVIIISSIVSIVMIKIALGALSETLLNFEKNQGQIVTSLSETCTMEALIQLNRDNTYTGGTYNYDAGDCSVTVTGTDNNRTIAMSATDINDYSKEIEVAVTLSPFEITAWDN